MSLFFTSLFQLSAAYFYTSVVLLIFVYRFKTPRLLLFSNRYLLIYAIYWLVLCITELPNTLAYGFNLSVFIEFLIRYFHLIIVFPVLLNRVAQSVAYTLFLMLIINPWRESIQNWIVEAFYQLIGEISVVSVQTGAILLFDHWNIVLMILICIHLFIVFHFYRRSAA